MKQSSNMPAAKLLIEFYFLRRAAFLVSMATKRQIWVGAFVIVSASTQEQAVDWWSVLLLPPADTLPLFLPPPVYSPIREKARVSNNADYSRSSHPSLLFHGFSG